MRYYLAKSTYLFRRWLPLYADDNSKIYTAYSTKILERLTTPNLTLAARGDLFLYFSEHFIGDVSSERLAKALTSISNPIEAVDKFTELVQHTRSPRAAILLKKTKYLLFKQYGIRTAPNREASFQWTAQSTDLTTETLAKTNTVSYSEYNFLYWPYLIWRFFFKFKNKSIFGHALQRKLLLILSSSDTGELLWLKTFERYSRLFQSHTDIQVLAENLKFRSPGHDLALLEFTYRFRRKKPKVLLFYRRLKLVLSSTLSTTLPEYRGSELAELFFNPLEDKPTTERKELPHKQVTLKNKRLRERERQKAKLKKAAAEKAEQRQKKRQQLLDTSKKRQQERELHKEQLKKAAIAKAQKRQKKRQQLLDASQKRQQKRGLQKEQLKKAASAKTEQRQKKRQTLLDASKKRQQKRELQKEQFKKAAIAKIEKKQRKRRRLVVVSEKKLAKTLKASSRKSGVNKDETEKIKIERSKTQDVTMQKRDELKTHSTRLVKNSKSKGPSLWAKSSLPTKIALDRLKTRLGAVNVPPVKLIMTTTSDAAKTFQYVSLNKRSMKSNTDIAIFYVTERLDPYLDLSLLAEYSKVIVLNLTRSGDSQLECQVRDFLGADFDIECFSPSRLFIKPYTEDHQSISDFSDLLAEKLIAKALASRELKSFLNPVLTDEYAVSLSDKLMRAIERFYASHLFFETVASDTPIFLNSANNDFQYSLVKLGFEKVVILGGETLLGKTVSLNQNDETPSTLAWIKKLRQASETALSKVQFILDAKDATQDIDILIASHSRSSIHKLAAQKIYEELGKNHSIQTIDIAHSAPLAANGENLHTLAYKLDNRLKFELQQAFMPSVRELLSSIPLNNFDMIDLSREVSVIISRNVGLILTHTAIFETVQKNYSGSKQAVAIVVPGRYGGLRTIAKAFHSMGFPTVDVQLLFLSSMARYKNPITTHHVVIDKATQDFYIKKYGISQNNIKIIGSITRDEDIKLALNFGRAASIKNFKLMDNHLIITLACQPGFEEVTRSALRHLADYLKERPSVSVCIKLHPAQPTEYYESTKDLVAELLSQDAQARMQVIHKDPFWKLMPSTDLLISYFSNVCLQACAFGIPILSLPGGGPRPDSDFESLGLFRNVESLDELASCIEKILSLPKAQRTKEPPYHYLQDNPHMADDKSLKRLKTYVGSLLAQKRD